MSKTQKTKLIAVNPNREEFEFLIKDNYEYTYKKQKINVDLISEPDGFNVISWKGIRYPVEIVAHKQNYYEFLINGVSYSFSVETPFSLFRSKLLSSHKSNSSLVNIKAPMPGKITDIMVREGQVINSGEPLLVLEAMKMQNTITTHLKGIIKKVPIKQGNSIAKGDVLIELQII